MDEKIFDLLNKLYSELQELKNTLATKDDIHHLEMEMSRMEHHLKNDIHTLYAGYHACSKNVSEIHALAQLASAKDAQFAANDLQQT